MYKINYLKLIVTCVCSIYFFYYGFSSNQWNFLDSVNLLIHEAGHVLFSFFGETLYVAGGSITQVILPLLFVFYFFKRSEFFSSGLLLFWLGQNFINISTYAGDALVMKLPLLGGNENVIHDWNFILNKFNILNYTTQISYIFHLTGIIIFILATYICITQCFEQEKIEFYNNKEIFPKL